MLARRLGAAGARARPPRPRWRRGRPSASARPTWSAPSGARPRARAPARTAGARRCGSSRASAGATGSPTPSVRWALSPPIRPRQGAPPRRVAPGRGPAGGRAGPARLPLALHPAKRAHPARAERGSGAKRGAQAGVTPRAAAGPEPGPRALIESIAACKQRGPSLEHELGWCSMPASPRGFRGDVAPARRLVRQRSWVWLA